MFPFFSSNGPDAGLNQSQAKEIIRRADATYEAIAGVRPAEPPAPTVRFKPQDVFDLIISGSKMAHFMLSEDLRTCGMCGSTDALQTDPEAHAPDCLVRRWFTAVEALKVGLEVRQ